MILVCRVNECTLEVRNKKRNLCNKHYIRILKHGDVDKVCLDLSKYADKRLCVVASCTEKAALKDMCAVHYGKTKRSTRAHNLKKPCSRTECTRTSLVDNLCIYHYTENKMMQIKLMSNIY